MIIISKKGTHTQTHSRSGHSNTPKDISQSESVKVKGDGSLPLLKLRGKFSFSPVNSAKDNYQNMPNLFSTYADSLRELRLNKIRKLEKIRNEMYELRNYHYVRDRGYNVFMINFNFCISAISTLRA